jgi:hypothetical protein
VLRASAPDDEGALSEALSHDVRRLRRRRWTLSTAAAAAILAAGTILTTVTFVTSGKRTVSQAHGAPGEGILRSGALARLTLAGPLAVSRDGTLYVTNGGAPAVEPFGDQILVRAPDGRFRIVAGTGEAGFSGDGGPAVRAELSSVSDLVIAPNGTLYVADAGRVRTIAPNGVIRTIVGNGQPARWVRNGTLALSAALGSATSGDALRIALNPANGELYIADVRQVLRLTPSGELETVRAVGVFKPDAGPLGNLTSIAVDRSGNIDVASPWAIWQIAPNGTARDLGFDRGSGGTFPVLQTGPGGAVYAENSGDIVRVESGKLAWLASFDQPIRRDKNFLTISFAVAPNGTIYADDIPSRIDTGAGQQLVVVSEGHASVLWEATGRGRTS